MTDPARLAAPAAPADPATADPSPAAGVPGFPGPFPVGRYSLKLREQLRGFADVCLIGEVTGARVGGGPNVWFELRDGDGALPCAMWRNDFDRMGLREDELRDGVEVVVAGGCDWYPGSASASPRLSFRVRELRLAGEGDLLARLARLRRQLAGEGLFEPQKRLARPRLPRRIGVVTAEHGAARRDFLAGLARRGWRGTVVWGYAPVQDRRAAPAVAQAIRDLAAIARVETIVVTRGGGSIADLWAFCDETLCRTVALTPVPVISAVGHEVDRTLIDDVAALSCSTPTHAAEAAVGVDCAAAAAELEVAVRRLDAAGRLAVVGRARALAGHSRAPREQLDRHRRALHQIARELRAATARGRAVRLDWQRRIGGTVLRRKAAVAAGAAAAEERRLGARAARLRRAERLLSQRRERALAAHAAALRAHDPERALERGYAVVLDAAGEPLASAAAARAAGSFDLRMAGGTVPARVRGTAAAAPVGAGSAPADPAAAPAGSARRPPHEGDR
ncbi:MAG TPA: exodeoxyribonuclease VII large subunit [Thermoleophilaceae bacterium]|jgi:exodeoxyribonuclease VII large subunit